MEAGSRGHGFSLAQKSMKSMLDYSDGGRHGEARYFRDKMNI